MWQRRFHEDKCDHHTNIHNPDQFKFSRQFFKLCMAVMYVTFLPVFCFLTRWTARRTRQMHDRFVPAVRAERRPVLQAVRRICTTVEIDLKYF
jgi:hypothetical protein